MKGILLADAGGTSTSWSLLTDNVHQPYRFNGEGINPVQHSEIDIFQSLVSAKRELPDVEIDHIFFFGAGCLPGKPQSQIENLIKKVWPDSDVQINSDLMAAAIALFGDGNGVACILGTGSNSCLYSNHQIIKNIPPLGFILGDEGSGAALGKELLNRYFKGLLDTQISEEFKKTYNPVLSDFIQKVYKESKPATFLASFAPFILENAEKPEIRDLILSEFHDFFTHNILQYGVDEETYIGFVGSLGFTFQNFIKECALEFGFSNFIFLKSPIEGLEKYYSQKYYHT